MRCEEIREQLIGLLYEENVDSPDNVDIKEHIRACSACRAELEELKQTRQYLQLWKDEAPPRYLALAGRRFGAPRRFNWKYPRYAAIAAMIMLCFLALANTQITWDSNGFSFRTQLWEKNGPDRNYYTKSEVREIMKQALDDSELRINETSHLMIQKMMDIVEEDRWNDLRLIRNRDASIRSRN